MTPGLSWFRPTRPYVQQRSVHCITCTEVLVVGGTSLGERVSEAPKSQSELGMRVLVCLSASGAVGIRCPCRAPAASFYRSRGGSYTCRICMGRLFSPQSGGEQLVFPVAEHFGAWRRAWASS